MNNNSIMTQRKIYSGRLTTLNTVLEVNADVEIFENDLLEILDSISSERLHDILIKSTHNNIDSDIINVNIHPFNSQKYATLLHLFNEKCKVADLNVIEQLLNTL